MSETNGYSVWLTPTGGEAVPLKRLIANLSMTLHSPLFVPHVTLLGGVCRPEGRILEHCRRLAAEMPPFRVRFTGVGWNDSFFRCLYLDVDTSPSLLRAHRTAVEQCGVVNDHSFMPHLSIAYGQLEEAKKQLVARDMACPYPPGFKVTHIDLVRTHGHPEDWRLVERFPFATEAMPVSAAR
ncbi:MAG: 2'-5' RNA ligase family protein [Pseudomonadota bacterium]|nr:2'-5' RNA ligase family protein [Pseudomonadota bacterium]